MSSERDTMPQPVASKGPTTGTHQARGKWAEFAQAMVDADGEWVEMEMGDTGTTHNRGYAEVYRCIGVRYAEVRRISGILYGRMRES